MPTVVELWVSGICDSVYPCSKRKTTRAINTKLATNLHHGRSSLTLRLCVCI